MGRIKKTFKTHVENMVTCGFSKSYQQFGSENLVTEESICSSSDISKSLIVSSSRAKDSKMVGKSALLGKKNNKIFCYNCSECGHKGTVKVRERYLILTMIFDINYSHRISRICIISIVSYT